MPQTLKTPGTLDALAPLLFVALWSTGFIGAKLGLPYAEPLTFLALRFSIVIVLMLAVATLARAPWPAWGKSWMHIGVAGLLVHGVYLGGVFIAIGQGLPSGITALVVGLQPLVSLVGVIRPVGFRHIQAGLVGQDFGVIRPGRFRHKQATWFSA